MIVKFSRITFNQLCYAFAKYQNPHHKPQIKPMPIKGPIKIQPISTPKGDEVSLSKAAEQLNIPEDALKKQLINPQSKYIGPEQLRILGIINGISLNLNQPKSQSSQRRSPVVTVMGHVDHGKTTLIDYLRKSNIAEKQFGGITQKIGAFHITCHGQKITFIDTPGHQAFSNMRKRGASVTDMIVLIVSATEGVKKQTKEVIDIINNQKIQAIVAINKIDLPTADVEQVENSLFEAGLNIEPKGGVIPVVHISAKAGINVDLLSQLILEQTKDLKREEKGLSEGVVLEGYKNEEGLNAMTLIVKKGVLKVGSLLIIGGNYCKVKFMHDDKRANINQAYSGDAVQIIGIPEIPTAGDFIYEVEDEAKAQFIISKKKQITTSLIQQNSGKSNLKTAKIKLDWKERKLIYGQNKAEMWLVKFNKKEQQLLQKIEQLKQKQKTHPQIAELVLEKEIQLENHKKYVYQFLVNISQTPNNFNVILRFADRGIEQTILQQLEPIKAKIKQNAGMDVQILKSDIGEITQIDFEQASTFNADIFTFGVQASVEALPLQQKFNIKPKIHKLIHNFLKDFQESAYNKKKRSIKGVERGRGTIAEIFKLKPKKNQVQQPSIPGVRVTSGKIIKTNKLYLFRKGILISDGFYIKAIKTFKKQVSEIKKDEECTIILENPNINFQKGDEFVSFEE